MSEKTFDTLVLSGESADGIITLGALQYLHDHHMLDNIHTYIGTSSGTMCNYLLAIGYSPIEILIYLESNNVFENIQQLDFIQFIKGNGCIQFNKIIKHLEILSNNKIHKVPTLLELWKEHKKKLIVTTYNLSLQKIEYIDYTSHPDLLCVKAIQMSSSIPIIFNNCIYNNHLYTDGGVVNNFPINKIASSSTALGICVVTESKSNEQYMYVNIFHKLLHILSNLIQTNTELRLQNIEDKHKIIKLTKNNSNISFFIKNKYNKLASFSNGYNKCKSHIVNNNLL